MTLEQLCAEFGNQKRSYNDRKMNIVIILGSAVLTSSSIVGAMSSRPLSWLVIVSTIFAVISMTFLCLGILWYISSEKRIKAYEAAEESLAEGFEKFYEDRDVEFFGDKYISLPKYLPTKDCTLGAELGIKGNTVTPLILKFQNGKFALYGDKGEEIKPIEKVAA